MPEVISPISKGITTSTITSITYDLDMEPALLTDSYLIASAGSAFPVFRYEITGNTLVRVPFLSTGSVAESPMPESKTSVACKINDVNYLVYTSNIYGNRSTSNRVYIYNADAKTFRTIENGSYSLKNSRIMSGLNRVFGAVLVPASSNKSIRVIPLVAGSFAEFTVTINGIPSDEYISQVFCTSTNRVIIGTLKGLSNPDSIYDNRLPSFLYSCDITPSTTTAAVLPVSTPAISNTLKVTPSGSIFTMWGNRIYVYNPVTSTFETFSNAEYGTPLSFSTSASVIALSEDSSDYGIIAKASGDTTENHKSFYNLRRVGDTFLPEFITRVVGSSTDTTRGRANTIVKSGDNVFAMQVIKARNSGNRQVTVGVAKIGEMPDWLTGTKPIYNDPVVLEPAPAGEPKMSFVTKAHGYMGG